MLVRKALTSKKDAHTGFRPDYIALSVGDIDFGYLQQSGIKACFIDLDGTVVSKGEFEVADTVKNLLQAIKLPIYIATNRPKSRALKDLKLDLAASGVIHPHGLLHPKPSKSYYRNALKEHNLLPHEVVMIGDRYLQDIFGANRAGLYSLVVHKTGKSIGWFDRLLSKTEAKATARYSTDYEQV